MPPNTPPTSNNYPDGFDFMSDVNSRSFESEGSDIVSDGAEPHPPKTNTQPTNSLTGDGDDSRGLNNSADRSHAIPEIPTTTTVPAVPSKTEFARNLLFQVSTSGGRDNGAHFTRRVQGARPCAVASVQKYDEDIRNFKHLPVPGSDPPEQPHEMPGIYPGYLHDAMGMSRVGGYCPRHMATPEEFADDLDSEGGSTAQVTGNDPFLGYGLPFFPKSPVSHVQNLTNVRRNLSPNQMFLAK